jgi:pterin-4a-carbinolamine dehydratase
MENPPLVALRATTATVRESLRFWFFRKKAIFMGPVRVFSHENHHPTWHILPC